MICLHGSVILLNLIFRTNGITCTISWTYPSRASSTSSTTMESRDEDSAISPTSDDALLVLRDLSIQCRELLHQLTADGGVAGGAEAGELKASFNIWAANMGVFREGRQSLASRLKNAPQISRLVQQLLMTLRHYLGNSCNSSSPSEMAGISQS